MSEEDTGNSGESVTGGSATSTANPASDVSQLAAGMEKIRDHLRKTSATLGAVATTVIGGLTFARLNDLFPLPPAGSGRDEVELGVIIGLVASVVGAGWLAGRFFSAQRRILITSRDARPDRENKNLYPELHNDLSGDEKNLVRQVLNDHAWEENVADLRTLELRSLRFGRIARDLEAQVAVADVGAVPQPNETAARLKAESGRLNGVLELAMARAAITLLEHRSSNASKGGKTKCAFLLAALGVALLWGSVNYSVGQRDLVTLRKDCAAAVKDGAIDACDSLESSQQTEAREAATRTKEAEAAKRADAVRKSLGSDVTSNLAIAKACSALADADMPDDSESAKQVAIADCIELVKKRATPNP